MNDWANTATADPAQLRRWSERWPGTNWGMATGARSGVVVLDIDPRHGGRLTHEAGVWCVYSGETVVCTIPSGARVHRTGSGGWHVFLACPSALPSRELAPGVELKADGCQVVLPPSRSGAGPYAVLHRGGDTLPELPEGLRPATGKSDAWRYATGTDPVPHGMRKKTATMLARILAGRGLSASDVSVRVRAEIAARFATGPSKLREADIADAITYGMTHPYQTRPADRAEARAQLMQIAEAVAVYPWRGVGGRTDERVMAYLLGRAVADERVHVRASRREVADGVAVSGPTATASLHRLTRAGFLRRIARKRETGIEANVYRVMVPRRVARLSQSAVPPTSRRDAGKELQHVLWGVLRGVKARLYEELDATPKIAATLARTMGASRASVSRALRQLEGEGLSARSGGGWVRGPVSLDAVAAKLGADKKASRRREHHALDRAGHRERMATKLKTGWFPPSKRKAVRAVRRIHSDAPVARGGPGRVSDYVPVYSDQSYAGGGQLPAGLLGGGA